jgi:hypothetical protein
MLVVFARTCDNDMFSEQGAHLSPSLSLKGGRIIWLALLSNEQIMMIRAGPHWSYYPSMRILHSAIAIEHQVRQSWHRKNHYYGSYNCKMSVSSYALTKKVSPLAHVV